MCSLLPTISVWSRPALSVAQFNLDKQRSIFRQESGCRWHIVVPTLPGNGMIVEATATLVTPVDRPHRAIVHELAPSVFNFDPNFESVSEHSALSLRPLAEPANCI